MQIKNISEDRLLLIAEDGMVITNDEDYGYTISLEQGKSPSDYYEITEEEYNNLK